MNRGCGAPEMRPSRLGEKGHMAPSRSWQTGCDRWSFCAPLSCTAGHAATVVVRTQELREGPASVGESVAGQKGLDDVRRTGRW